MIIILKSFDNVLLLIHCCPLPCFDRLTAGSATSNHEHPIGKQKSLLRKIYY